MHGLILWTLVGMNMSRAFGGTSDCPQTQLTPKLSPGQTAQKTGQVKCEKKSGFSSFHCPDDQISGTFYFAPFESQPQSLAPYARFYNCLDQGSSVKHTVVDGQVVLVCRPPDNSDSPHGCCNPTSSDGAVNVEGTGFTKDGKVIEYTGEVHESQCPRIFGAPTIMAGGSHRCLVPFISVACDTQLYSYGTIFEIPMLKDVMIPMPPDGKKQMRHPGYVICEDTGSAITGPGRFDFYVGTYGDRDGNNIFSDANKTNPKLNMELEDCRPDKSYKVIKHSDPNWKAAYRQIRSSVMPGETTNAGSSKQPWFTERKSVQ